MGSPLPLLKYCVHNVLSKWKICPQLIEDDHILIIICNLSMILCIKWKVCICSVFIDVVAPVSKGVFRPKSIPVFTVTNVILYQLAVLLF